MKTVLSIGAHPDDIEIGCGGFERRLLQSGYRLIHAIITDGAEGSRSEPKQRLIDQRAQEAKESARILGADEVIFFGQSEAHPFDADLKVRLIELIRRTRPEIVLTHASSEMMGDHRRVREVVDDAVTLAAGPWYAEQGTPHRVRSFYGYEVWTPIQRPGLVIDITETIATKCEALRAHQSQLQDIDYLAAVQGLARYRGILLQKGSYAEAFEVIHTSCVMPG